MKNFVIQKDDAPNIKFEGEEIASATSRYDSGSDNGKNGRWVEVTLYKTRGGKFVCHRVGLTCWEGEVDRHEAEVCANEKEVIKFFGYGHLSKRIYEQANISHEQIVE